MTPAPATTTTTTSTSTSSSPTQQPIPSGPALPIDIQISGAVLSALQFEMMSSHNNEDLAGILASWRAIGGIRTNVSSSITDDQAELRTKSTHVIVTSFCPLPAPNLHINIWGQFHPDIFKSMGGPSGAAPRITDILPPLHSLRQNAVGFFRFRRNSPLSMSLKEGAMYDSLRAQCEGVKRPAHIQPDQIVAAIFTTGATEASTLNIDFGCFRRTVPDADFDKVPVVISNIIESSQLSKNVFISSMSPSARPTNVLESGLSELSLRHLADYESLFQTGMGQLKAAVQQLSETEQELNRLRQEWAAKSEAAAARRGRAPPPPPPSSSTAGSFAGAATPEQPLIQL
ncbi:hypothetical protein DFJ73DRAFT_905313 [Zopfochytrium polystomum]|nr:hypothetical protein DFJ73DRAFT_905313 [Zopfochytrium polystomum]